MALPQRSAPVTDGHALASIECIGAIRRVCRCYPGDKIWKQRLNVGKTKEAQWSCSHTGTSQIISTLRTKTRSNELQARPHKVMSFRPRMQAQAAITEYLPAEIFVG